MQHNLQMRDVRASEIMGMYETKLQEAIGKVWHSFTASPPCCKAHIHTHNTHNTHIHHARALFLSPSPQEQRLASLLEAKTAALQHSDRLLAEYQAQQAILDEECAKLRAMLRVWASMHLPRSL